MKEKKQRKSGSGVAKLTHVLGDVSRRAADGIVDKTLATFHFEGMPVDVVRKCLEFLECKELRLVQRGLSKQLHGKLESVRTWVIDRSDVVVLGDDDMTKLFGPCEPEALRHVTFNSLECDELFEECVAWSPNATTIEINDYRMGQNYLRVPLASWPKLTNVLMRVQRLTVRQDSDALSSVLAWLDSAAAQTPTATAIGALGCISCVDSRQVGLGQTRLLKLCQCLERLPAERRPTHMEYGLQVSDLSPLLKLLPKLRTLRLFGSQDWIDAGCSLLREVPVASIAEHGGGGKQLRDLQIIGHDSPRFPVLDAFSELTTLQIEAAKGSEFQTWDWNALVDSLSKLTKLRRLRVAASQFTGGGGGGEAKVIWPELELLHLGSTMRSAIIPEDWDDFASFLKVHTKLRHVSAAFALDEAERDVKELRALLQPYIVDSIGLSCPLSISMPDDDDKASGDVSAVFDAIPSTVQELVLQDFPMNTPTIRMLKRFPQLRVLDISGEFGGENLNLDPDHAWLDELPKACPRLRCLRVGVLQTFPTEEKSAFLRMLNHGSWPSLVSADIRNMSGEPLSGRVGVWPCWPHWRDMATMWI